ncbi:hypothetical protein GDO78_008496 [Eleutherodactylus coqui]|uniref:Uncharacterized protein n=1 Tax=Eleutherodactylus coqui TaxID=57060 RepID=A0A8J6KBB2_ELECQ|nr:hypothetical protein GDO78_008496 [Eleutherodactylus coqui]
MQIQRPIFLPGSCITQAEDILLQIQSQERNSLEKHSAPSELFTFLPLCHRLVLYFVSSFICCPSIRIELSQQCPPESKRKHCSGRSL